jgi:hypothetical protein
LLIIAFTIEYWEILMSFIEELKCQRWDETMSSSLQLHAVTRLEEGNILLFPHLSFALDPYEAKFLSAKYANEKTKNISLEPHHCKMQGYQCTEEEYPHLRGMLQRYSQYATGLVNNLFPGYASALQMARTSYRPVEIKGRISPSYRKDDTRLHVDAFPANPNQGRRILRVFSNINPHGQSRVWRVGESFEEVATRFLPKISSPLFGVRHFMNWLGITKTYRSDYDHIMLNIHDTMKGDLHYQATVNQEQVLLPPTSTWIVQTDHVSHAAMEGQFVLEQTFYLPVSAMQNESHSPLRVLERLTKRKLV